MNRSLPTLLGALAAIVTSAGCLTDDALTAYGSDLTAGSPEAAAVLALVNDASVDADELDLAASLDARAARNIVAHRDGSDGVAGTGDDDLFDDLAELDAVSYVGNSALAKLLDYAIEQGLLSETGPDAGAGGPTDEDIVLALVNDLAVDLGELDDDAGLNSRAAANIIAHRDGADAQPGTSDDDLFDDLNELDAVSYVGAAALDQLLAYAIAQGYPTPSGTTGGTTQRFSPADYDNSHLSEVIARISNAEHSVDVAMYSMSDNRAITALSDAAARGVSVRVVFEGAQSDRKKTGADLDNSRSGRLEHAGCNVRYVNKIMHNKFAIIDGPRDDASRASTATVVTGSANWSSSAYTRYDENTLFVTGHAEMNLRYQREFNTMWDHSRDIEVVALPYELSTFDITDADITAVDDADLDAVFTSDNFNISAGSTTFRKTTRTTMSDALVSSIEGADTSILIASGHLRSYPIAQALIAKRAASPDVDIRVYLDGQEFVSTTFDQTQNDKLDACLAAATTETQTRNCLEVGHLYGKTVGDAGVDVAYKFYAFRWAYPYAKQMHNKLILIDGDEAWLGSYNLSNNAESNTFENMVHLSGATFADTIAAYNAQFETMWTTGATLYAPLLSEISSATDVPIVFDSMALSWGQVNAIRGAIMGACGYTTLYSDEYRENPEFHYTCPAL